MNLCTYERKSFVERKIYDKVHFSTEKWNILSMIIQCLHACVHAMYIPAYTTFICSMSEQSGKSSVCRKCRLSSRFSQRFNSHECDCAIFLYLPDQGSRIGGVLWIGIKFIQLVGQQSSRWNFVEDNSKCKVIKMPLKAFNLLETKWTSTKQKGNN